MRIRHQTSIQTMGSLWGPSCRYNAAGFSGGSDATCVGSFDGSAGCGGDQFRGCKPASQPSDSSNSTLVKPSDHEAIVANIKQVAIEATIDKAEWSKSGKAMIATFDGGAETKLQAVILVKDREKLTRRTAAMSARR